MESRIYCAYNVSRGKHLAAKALVVDRADQPLTVMRLLVECLGFKAQTGLWLSPLHNPPQLVRPFPFDLLYLDQNLRVITAVELRPEVQFPEFHEHVASALILPIRTISGTGTEECDELIICAPGELECRLSEAATPVLVSAEPVAVAASVPALAVSITPSVAEPIASIQTPATNEDTLPVLPVVNPAPAPSNSDPAFLPARISPLTQNAGFTLGVTTTWHVAKSTFEAALTGAGDAKPEGDTADESSRVVAAPDEIETAKPDPVETTEPKLNKTAAENPAPKSEVLQEVPSEVAKVEAQLAVPSSDNPPARYAVLSKPETLQTSRNEPAGSTPVLGVFDVKERAIPASPPVEDALSMDMTVAPAARTPGKEAPKTNTAKTRSSSRPGSVAAVPQERVTRPDVPKPAKESARSKQSEVVRESKSETAVKGPDNKKKTFGFLVKEFLNCPDPLPENRMSARLVQQGIVAYDKPDDLSTAMQVRDVSASGFYLLTRKKWQPGHVLTLRLERNNAREDEFQSRVDVQASVVRCDHQGVGLKWIFPDGAKFEPWDRLHTKRSDESDLQYFIRELRLTRAQGFLQRISPLAKSEIRHALHERLSNKRVASAVEIALRAEKLLSRNGISGKVLAHPDVVMRIIESGSWIEDNWIRPMWAGLLVSACTADGQDTSNLTFIDLLARQTPVHLRILSYVCKRMEEAGSADTSQKRVDVLCTAQELTDAADSHSLARIHQTVGQLANSGLIVEGARPSYGSVLDKEKTKATPTSLGFMMYARCNGRRT